MTEENATGEENIEAYLRGEADRISELYGGAPVVIVVGGSTQGTVHLTTTAWSLNGIRRFRDVLGILEEAIQRESIVNLQPDERRQSERRSGGERRQQDLPRECWPTQAEREGDRRQRDRRSIPQMLAEARELLKEPEKGAGT